MSLVWIRRSARKVASRRNGWLCACFLLVATLFLDGCTRKHYQKSADNEVYKAISQKSTNVPGMVSNFTIQTNQAIKLDDLPTLNTNELAMGTEGEMEKDARVMSLNRALEIAFKTSRNYQTRKETLYLEALSLTLARHKFTPIFSSGASTRYYRQKREDVVNGVDKLTEEHRVEGSATVGMDVMLRSGARIATDFTTDFTRYLIGDTSVATGSRLAGTITQPLLRNGGYKATMENLTQAERNLLYALRDFTQFRQDYVVQIVTAYYNVLSARDSMRNSYLGYQAFKRTAARTRALVQEGQQKASELGRLQQEELNNETSWINSIRDYKQAIDQFKITLGLSPDLNIVLDDRELEKLKINHPKINQEDAIRLALSHRLDLYNERDRFEDAARKIDVAANGLKPDLDLVLQANVGSKPGSGLPELDFTRTTWNGGFDLNLPLDRKAERNNYRSTLITYERTLRELELKVDNIKLDIYDGLRRLEQARRNYESSEMGVELSKRRVLEQNILFEEGRGTAEEQVAAQNSLTSSLNQRTRQMVNHNTTRLSFWRDLGMLTVDVNGQWQEITEVTKK